tara:strand:- start:1048 stop:2754 length:1707 start_codon:yes stop_codon:yes gene_type:complete
MVSSLIGTIMNDPDSNINKDIVESGSLNAKLENFINTFISGEPIEKLQLVCIYLFIAYVLKNIFYYINQTTLSYVQLNIIKDIRNKLFTKIQNFPLRFFDKKRSGELLSILLHDISAIRIALTRSFQHILNEIINISIMLTMLFIISPNITLVVMATIPFAGFITIKIGQSIRRKAKRSSFKIADISHHIQESIYGIKIIKAFNMKVNEIKRFISENLKFNNLMFRQEKLKNLTTPINDLIGVSIAVILLWYGGSMVLMDNPSMSSESFMRYIIFLFALLQPARKLGSSIAAIQTGIASANRVNGILEIKEDEIEEGLEEIDSFIDSIEFNKVSFRYENSNNDALKNINIKFKKGQTIALVGKSGSGKTTFTNLLLRFYNSTKGDILLDNKKISTISKESLRNIMSVVTQDPILFNDTIYNNITYGTPNASKNQVKDAAKIANISDFIESLDDKYNSMVGEKGTQISGGEKQRISIARAILRDPEILILDEATSSLDSESEKIVQDAINNLIEDRTVFIIAHRLSTIKNADVILVFDKGEIIEKGDHESLINQNSMYKKFYNNQINDN